MNDKGTTLYQQTRQGNISRVVYFSTSRVVDFEGEIDENLAKIIRADGHLVESIDMDEFHDSIRILQSKIS